MPIMSTMSTMPALDEPPEFPDPEWTLGERIHKCRKLMGLEQEPFGKLLDPPVSYSLVSKWENDIREPKLSQLRDIERFAPVPKGFLIRSRCTSLGELRLIPGGQSDLARKGQLALPLFTQSTDN